MLEPTSGAIVFLQGLASFLSPCVLPLIPAYLAMLGGSSADDPIRQPRARLIFNTLAFVLGFTLVFTLLGATATAVGSFLNRYARVIGVFSGFLVMLFGLVTIGVLRVPLLEREGRFDMSKVNGGGLFKSALMGIAFSFGWTPCIGPVLTSVLILAGRTASVWSGIGLLLLYSLGLGLPFMALSIFLKALQKPLSALKKHSLAIRRVSGAVLIIMGLLMITDTFSLLAKLGAPDLSARPQVEQAAASEPTATEAPVPAKTPSTAAIAPTEVPATVAPAPAEMPATSAPASTEVPSLPPGIEPLSKDRADELATMLNEIAFDPIELESLEGETLSTDDFSGVRVINLLATWCPYCIEELPILTKVTSEMGVPLIGIDTYENASKAAVKRDLNEMLSDLGASFPILLDTTNEWGAALSPRGSIPVTLILDPDGIVRFYVPGAFRSEDDLRDLLIFVLCHLDEYA